MTGVTETLENSTKKNGEGRGGGVGYENWHLRVWLNAARVPVTSAMLLQDNVTN